MGHVARPGVARAVGVPIRRVLGRTVGDVFQRQHIVADQVDRHRGEHEHAGRRADLQGARADRCGRIMAPQAALHGRYAKQEPEDADQPDSGSDQPELGARLVDRPGEGQQQDRGKQVEPPGPLPPQFDRAEQHQDARGHVVRRAAHEREFRPEPGHRQADGPDRDCDNSQRPLALRRHASPDLLPCEAPQNSIGLAGEREGWRKTPAQSSNSHAGGRPEEAGCRTQRLTATRSALD